MRITSAEWKGGRQSTGVVVSLAVVAHGLAFIVLSLAVGSHGTPLSFLTPVAPRAVQREHLRFVATAIPAPTVRRGALSADRQPSPVPAAVPRGAPVRPPVDTAAASLSPVSTASAPAAAPTVASLAVPLPVDPRLVVAPSSANAGVDTSLHYVNALIGTGVRGVNDSIARYKRGWTVGDSTHRVGIAPCGIEAWVVCIPFGVGSMPNPATSSTGIDLRHAADEVTVRAAIARIRAKDSKSTDGAPEPTGP